MDTYTFPDGEQIDIEHYEYIENELRKRLSKEVEALSLDTGDPNAQLNALGMKILVLEILRGKNGRK